MRVNKAACCTCNEVSGWIRNGSFWLLCSADPTNCRQMNESALFIRPFKESAPDDFWKASWDSWAWTATQAASWWLMVMASAVAAGWKRSQTSVLHIKYISTQSQTVFNPTELFVPRSFVEEANLAVLYLQVEAQFVTAAFITTTVLRVWLVLFIVINEFDLKLLQFMCQIGKHCKQTA